MNVIFILDSKTVISKQKVRLKQIQCNEFYFNIDFKTILCLSNSEMGVEPLISDPHQTRPWSGHKKVKKINK